MREQGIKKRQLMCSNELNSNDLDFDIDSAAIISVECFIINAIWKEK